MRSWPIPGALLARMTVAGACFFGCVGLGGVALGCGEFGCGDGAEAPTPEGPPPSSAAAPPVPDAEKSAGAQAADRARPATPPTRRSAGAPTCDVDETTVRLAARVAPRWVGLAYGAAGGLAVWPAGPEPTMLQVLPLDGRGFPNGAARRVSVALEDAVGLVAVGDAFVLVTQAEDRIELRPLGGAEPLEGPRKRRLRLDGDLEAAAVASRGDRLVLGRVVDRVPVLSEYRLVGAKLDPLGERELELRGDAPLVLGERPPVDAIEVAVGPHDWAAWLWNRAGDSPTFIVTGDEGIRSPPGLPRGYDLHALRWADDELVAVLHHDGVPRAVRLSPGVARADPVGEADPSLPDRVDARLVQGEGALWLQRSDARGRPVGRPARVAGPGLGQAMHPRWQHVAWSGEAFVTLRAEHAGDDLWTITVRPVRCFEETPPSEEDGSTEIAVDPEPGVSAPSETDPAAVDEPPGQSD